MSPPIPQSSPRSLSRLPRVKNGEHDHQNGQETHFFNNTPHPHPPTPAFFQLPYKCPYLRDGISHSKPASPSSRKIALQEIPPPSSENCFCPIFPLAPPPPPPLTSTPQTAWVLLLQHAELTRLKRRNGRSCWCDLFLGIVTINLVTNTHTRIRPPGWVPALWVNWHGSV